MTENKRFTVDGLTITENSQKGRKYLLEYQGGVNALCNRINGLFDKSERLEKENEQLKKELKRYKDWVNSDKNDYELILSFIKNKGYSLKDVLKYEKEVKK